MPDARTRPALIVDSAVIIRLLGKTRNSRDAPWIRPSSARRGETDTDWNSGPAVFDGSSSRAVVRATAVPDGPVATFRLPPRHDNRSGTPGTGEPSKKAAWIVALIRSPTT